MLFRGIGGRKEREEREEEGWGKGGDKGMGRRKRGREMGKGKREWMSRGKRGRGIGKGKRGKDKETKEKER